MVVHAMAPSTIRLFSDDGSDTDSESLADILARELAEEEENDSGVMPEPLLELHDSLSEDWTIVDDDASGNVKMFSKGGAFKVAVVFHCQDTIEGEYEDLLEEDEAAPATRFTVTVTRAGKTMVFHCVSEHAVPSVLSVGLTSEPADAVHTNGKIGGSLYQVRSTIVRLPRVL